MLVSAIYQHESAIFPFYFFYIKRKKIILEYSLSHPKVWSHHQHIGYYSEKLGHRDAPPSPAPHHHCLRATVLLVKAIQFSSVQLLSHVRLFVTPWTSAHQASLSITNSWSLLKLMTIELVMPFNHLILCRPLLLPLQSFPASEFFQMSQVAKVLEFQLQHQSFQ